MSHPPEIVAVAQVLTSFGVRGEIKARILTDFPERFLDTERLYLVSPQGVKEEHALQGVRFHKGYALLKLEGIETPDAVAPYRQWTLGVPETELMPLEEDEYWHFQIKGLKVYDQEGQLRGTVRDIYSYPGCDQYVVRNELGQEMVIPAVGRFIKEVDLAGGRLLVELPGE